MQRSPHDPIERSSNTESDQFDTMSALKQAERNAYSSSASSSGRQGNKAQSLRSGTNSASRQSGSSSSSQPARRRASSPSQPARRPSASGSSQARRSASSSQRPVSSRTGSSPERRPSQTRSASQRTSSQARSSANRRPAQTRSAGTAYPSRGAASSNSRNYSKARKKSSGKGFKKFIIVYSAILLVILIVGLIVFNSFIANYENNQPVNIAKSVAEELSTEPASYLEDHKDMISSMADTGEVISKYTDMVSGKQVSYVENSDSRADAPSFDLRVDGATVGKITLEPDGKGSFGLSKWKLSSLNIAEYLPDTYSYTILAPAGYTVDINGNELSEDAITAHDETPEILANAAQFIKEVPKYDSYTVAGLLSVPEVTSKDSSGSSVGVAAAQEYFVAGGEPDASFVKEQQEFVENALRSWAYHFINYNQGTNLANYVQSGSDLYSYIFGSDTMDPIYTGFYDWEYITNVEFTDFEVKNFIQYADDCYSVDVKYRLKVDFSNANLSDDGQMLDATWVIVQNKGYWGIADVIYHQGTENSLANDVAAKDSAEETTTAADDSAETETTGETEETEETTV